MLTLYVGYDPREAGAYVTFCQSVIEHASGPVAFVPLHKPMLDGFDGQQDGTTAFIYSRYLVPYLQNYEGFALFCDGDMHVTEDIYELFKLRSESYAVQVVKHNYKTVAERKFVGTPLENYNVDYPRKNWSSVILWNCGHPSNKLLTPEYVGEAGGSVLHRFQWLRDDEVGQLPFEWNWLVSEYGHNEDARLYHHTLGVPGFAHYAESPYAREWNNHLLNAINLDGERAYEVVRRAHWHRSTT